MNEYKKLANDLMALISNEITMTRGKYLEHLEYYKRKLIELNNETCECHEK